MKTKENVKKSNFTKLTRGGISLIVLVITIIVIIILAAAIIISLNNNNPIMEANTARYESDRANMQAVFTNAVAKVMAKNQATVSVSAGQINTITGGVKETDGQVAYTLKDAQNEENATGTIVFDKKDNTDTTFYTGKKLPIYAAGDTKWYVDDEGNISLEVAGTKYGNGEIVKPQITLISGQKFNELIPETTVNIEFLSTAAPEGVNTIDLSEAQDGSVLGWLNGTTYKIAPKNAGDIICANPDSSKMFSGNSAMKTVCTKIESIKFDNFNTSNVTNMSNMFKNFGYSATNLNFYGLETWNTSNVKNMNLMFSGVGRNSTTLNLNCISNWDVSMVERMYSMFSNLGYNSTEIYLNLTNWNVSSVTDMESMFSFMGFESETLNIGDLSNWNVSNVTDMGSMFLSTAQNAKNWK